MSDIAQLLRVVRTYAEAEGIGTSAMSWRVFGDTKKLAALEAGADIVTRRLEKAFQWLSDHWTDKAEWPVDVRRPARSEAAA